MLKAADRLGSAVPNPGTGGVMSDRDTCRNWLGIYLNAHLASATAGMELARRAARGNRDAEHGTRLSLLARDIAADQRSLVQLMRSLGVRVRHSKIFAGWLRGKAAGVLTRSPLRDLIEMETLYLGIQGMAAGWRVLLAAAANGAAVDEERLRLLHDRANNQLAVAEDLRIQAGTRAFVPD
jgi:hypothetical protein